VSSTLCARKSHDQCNFTHDSIPLGTATSTNRSRVVGNHDTDRWQQNVEDSGDDDGGDGGGDDDDDAKVDDADGCGNIGE
jgi:hypothetical protein